MLQRLRAVAAFPWVLWCVGCAYDLDRFQPAGQVGETGETSTDTSSPGEVGPDTSVADVAVAEVAADASACLGKGAVDCWTCCGGLYPKAVTLVEVSSKLHECTCRDEVCATPCSKQTCRGSTIPLGEACAKCMASALTPTCASELATVQGTEPTLAGFVECTRACR